MAASHPVGTEGFCLWPDVKPTPGFAAASFATILGSVSSPVVFPFNSFLCPAAPPLPYSAAPSGRFAPFQRYYEAAKISAARYAALRIPSSRVYFPSSVSFRSLRVLGVSLPLRLGVGRPVSPLLRLFSWGRSQTDLSSSQGTLSLPLPCSQTPVGSPRQASCGCFDAAPAVLTTKAPTSIIVSRLNHTALAFAPYASCRHLCRLRNVRYWLAASLCKVGFLGPCKEFLSLFSFDYILVLTFWVS
jgi:hypothetical protein